MAGPSVVSASLDGSYYPSWKVRLIIRFEEFGSTAVQKTAPPKPTPLLKGSVDLAAPLKVQVDNSVPGVRRFAVVQSGASPAPGGPQGQSASADDKTHVIAGIIPKRLKWDQNGIRTGASCSFTIKYVDAPFDPRTIRSCAVEVYGGTVRAEDYAAGVAGQTRTGSTGDVNYAEPLNVIPDTFVDPLGVSRSNLRFQGWVDDWKCEWDSEAEPLIQFDCVDNTRLLIDVQVPVGLYVATNLPLDRAIADYLSNFPNFAGLTVSTLPAGSTPPALATALAGTAYQPQLGPPPARGGGALEKIAVWDYLTDLCGSVGYLIRLVGRDVVLQLPENLIGGTGATRPDDPFKGRTVDGESFTYRRLVWGRNTGKVTIGRKFTKRVAQSVIVRCYSTRRKNTLLAFFPDPKSQTALLTVKALPGDGNSQQNWVEWRVRGIEDQATLNLIARQIYQQVGRNELSLDAKTNSLASFGGDNLDPDIFDLRAGDTFEFLQARSSADPANAVGAAAGDGTIAEIEQRLIADAVTFMQGLGFDAGIAQAYATAYVNSGFQTLYRLRTMTVEWDGDEEGVSIELHGANYVEVRANQPTTKASP